MKLEACEKHLTLCRISTQARIAGYSELTWLPFTQCVNPPFYSDTLQYRGAHSAGVFGACRVLSHPYNPRPCTCYMFIPSLRCHPPPPRMYTASCFCSLICCPVLEYRGMKAICGGVVVSSRLTACVSCSVPIASHKLPLLVVFVVPGRSGVGA